jgi:FG-GAP-like repeat
MRPETKAKDGVDRVVDAPDLDGDGICELVAVSRFDGRIPPASRNDRRSEPERIWGEADGQLRAFRGEPPEAWRALGAFPPASNGDSSLSENLERRAADFDGDGIADTLSGRLNVSGNSTSEETGSRTAIARSGGDGHVLWKTVLDPPWLWFLPEPRRSYSLAAFPLPAGDLDGDGTPDVLVQKHTQDESAIGRQPAALPLQLLSGRDGRHRWAAGPLPLGFEAHGFSQVAWLEPRVIEPNAPPDLIVLHRSPFRKANAKPIQPSPWAQGQTRLARVSGQTGRIVWDIPLEEQPSPLLPGRTLPPNLADLDGDGRLDATVVIRQPGQTGQSKFELTVISLHDGVRRWSRLLDYQGFVSEFPSVAIGKGTSNEPATVFVTELPTTNTSNELLVHALDGRDGRERSTWRSGLGEGNHKVYGGIDAIARDRDGKDSICVTYSNLERECRVLILDSRGPERVHRVLPPESGPRPYFPPVGAFAIDLDGDGRDELIVGHDNRLHAWGSDLKDQWSIPDQDQHIVRVLPASAAPSSTLILTPATAIDGMSGQVRWTYKPLAPWNRDGGDLLDPGDTAQMPRLVFTRNSLLGTICRHALPATPRGDYVPPSGARTPPGLARNDPRWMRPLPWTNLMATRTAETGLLAVVGLALLNVVLPLGILRLAARRRPWTLLLLMALPVAAAVPLTAFPALEPLIPIPTQPTPLPSSPMTLFALGSAAGVPIVSYVLFAGCSLARRRWRTLALLLSFTVFASLAIATIWLRLDMRDMPAIEQYSRSGWYLALLPGAFVVGALTLIGRAIRGLSRGIRLRAVGNA